MGQKRGAGWRRAQSRHAAESSKVPLAPRCWLAYLERLRSGPLLKNGGGLRPHRGIQAGNEAQQRAHVCSLLARRRRNRRVERADVRVQLCELTIDVDQSLRVPQGRRGDGCGDG